MRFIILSSFSVSLSLKTFYISKLFIRCIVYLNLIQQFLWFIMLKAPSLLLSKCYIHTTAVITLSSEIMPCCLKVGLVYVVIIVSRQLSACFKCIKVNMRSSCNICLVSNTKYKHLITYFNYYVPYLICLKVLYPIYY